MLADAIDQPLNIHTAGGIWQKQQAEIPLRHINMYMITKYVQHNTLFYATFYLLFL